MRYIIAILIGLAICFTCMHVYASDVEEVEIGEIEDISHERFYGSDNYPRVERAVNLLFANPTRAGSFLFVVDHRNRQQIDDEPFHNFLGFDGGGLKVGIGLRYGLWDFLDAGFYRENGTTETFDTYDFDVRFQILNQEDHFIDLAIRPGYTWFSQENEEDASAGFCQLLVSRSFMDRLVVGTGYLYHSDSSNDVKTDQDDDDSHAVQGLMELRVLPWLALDAEICANVGGYGSDNPQFRGGFKILTNKHTFAIVVSNTQYMSAGGVVSDTNNDFGDLVLGFSITRELPW